MATGILGAYALITKTYQAIYVNNNDRASIVTVNFNNRNDISAFVRIAISTNATTPLASEFVEYDAEVLGMGVLERSGLVVGPGQFIVVYSSQPNCSAQSWGVEAGTQVVNPVSITANTSGAGPVWFSANELGPIYTGSNDATVYSYNFNGTTMGLRLPTNQLLEFSSGAFTIEFWFKCGSTQNANATICDASTNSQSLSIGVGSFNGGTAGRLNFFGYLGSTLTSTTVVTNNTWRHALLSRNGANAALYLNGTLEASSTGWAGATNLYLSDGCIGRSRFSAAADADKVFTGLISNFRVLRGVSTGITGNTIASTITVPTAELTPINGTVLLTLQDSTPLDNGPLLFTMTPQTVVPTVGSVDIPSITAGDVFLTSQSVTLQASDPLVTTYAVTSGSLPGGMTLNSTTGVISGIPSSTGYNVNGVASSFTVTATNSASNATAKAFTLTRRWRDGSNRVQAARSAADIRALGITTDGDYWLQPFGCPRPFISHCYNSIESGGWQLVFRFPTDLTNATQFNRNQPWTASWEGWNYQTQDDIEALGWSPVGTGAGNQPGTDAFSPSFAHASFRDVMVIANDSANIAKRVGWRHNVPINNMWSVTGGKNSETVGDSNLFGDSANWLSSLHVRADTTVYTGGTRYGFKIRSDTGSSNTTRDMTGGFGGLDRFTDTAITGHYYSIIGCGRENSNSSQWGGGIGGVYNGSVFHRISGHWWGFGDGRSSGAWSGGDRSDAFFGHAVYVRA